MEGGWQQSPLVPSVSARLEAEVAELRQQVLDFNSARRPLVPPSIKVQHKLDLGGGAARPPRPTLGRVRQEGGKESWPDQVARLEGQVAAMQRVLDNSQSKATLDEGKYFEALKGEVRQVGEEVGVPDGEMQRVRFLMEEAQRRVGGGDSQACEEGDAGLVEDGSGQGDRERDPSPLYFLRSRLRSEMRGREGEGAVGRGTPSAKRVLRDLPSHNTPDSCREVQATNPSLMKQVRGVFSRCLAGPTHTWFLRLGVQPGFIRARRMSTLQ